MSRHLLATWPPAGLLTIQLTGSSASLVALFVISERKPVRWATLRRGWSGILEPGLSHLFSTFGLARTTASHASIVGSIEPLLVILCAWVLLGQRPHRRVFPLLALSMIGVIGLEWAPGGGWSARVLSGDALVALGVFWAALYVIANSRPSSDASALELAAFQQVTALILIGLIAVPLEGLALRDAARDMVGLLLALVSGFVGYGLAFWLFLLGLRRLNAASSAFVLVTIPVFTVIGAWLFLDERLSATQITSGAMVVVALGLLARGPVLGCESALSPADIHTA